MKKFTRVLTILAIAFWAGSLCAMPIVVTDPTGTILLRVDGLEVNDTLLDVTFAPG